MHIQQLPSSPYELIGFVVAVVFLYTFTKSRDKALKNIALALALLALVIGGLGVWSIFNPSQNHTPTNMKACGQGNVQIQDSDINGKISLHITQTGSVETDCQKIDQASSGLTAQGRGNFQLNQSKVGEKAQIEQETK